MKKVGMHMHSFYSDGELDPQKLVRVTKEAGVWGACLADHDTFGGQDEFAEEAQELGMETISAMEVSCNYKKRHYIHILAYGIEFHKREAVILEYLRRNWEGHELTTDKFIDGAIKYFDLSFSIDQLLEQTETPGPYKSSLAIVFFLSNALSISNEDIRKTIFGDQPSFAESILTGKFLSLEEAMELIRYMGGRPVWAHPHLLKNYTIGDPLKHEEFDDVLHSLLDLGLCGIETFYPYKEDQEENIARSIQLAKKYGLWMTAGSDYHGKYKPSCGPAMPGMTFKEFMKFKEFCES